MIFSWGSPLEFACELGLIIFSVAVALCLVRVVLGPSLSDRVVALDMVGTILVGGLIILAIAQDRADAVHVATVLALLNFIGTAGFAIFTHRGIKR